MPAPTLYAQPAPAPAPAPQPAAPAYQEAEEPESDEGKCLLGNVCLGPVLTLGVLNPIGIGAHARIAEHFGVAIEYQFLPSITYKDVSAGISLFTLTGRWHVGGSAFFLGGGLSVQSFWAEATIADPLTNDSARMEASVTIPQLMLGLGVMGGEGFVMGIDLALGIPLGSTSVEFEGEMPQGSDEFERMYTDNQESIDKVSETLLELLPATFQLNLIRIGYLF